MQWSEPGDVMADMRTALDRLRTMEPPLRSIAPRRVASVAARFLLAREIANAHDHHSHHIHGHFTGPDGEWHENTPEVKARLAAEYRKGQARRWRRRYREIVRGLRA